MSVATDSSAAPIWPTCQAADGCRGVRVDASGACLAHLDESELADWLATLGPGSNLDLRGTQVEAKRLARLLTALREEQYGPPRLGRVRFDRAQFTGNARFDRAQFTGEVWFREAQFTRGARFDGAQFRSASFVEARFTGDAWFDKAQFTEPAYFDGAQFTGDAWFRGTQLTESALFRGARFTGAAGFDGAQFTGGAWFDKAQFTGDAWFRGAQFSREARFVEARFIGDAWGAWFDRAQFTGDAGFDRAQFTGNAWFRGAQFTGNTQFEGAQFTGDAGFDEARFAHPVTLGPLLVRGTLSLSAASFEDTLVVEAVAARARLDRATCAADVTIRVRYAEVVLDGVQLAQSATLAAAGPFTRTTASGPVGFDETAFAQPGRSPTPHMLSVRSTDVATLVVTDLTLAPCQFAGAYHLDQLRLEGAIEFARPPRGLRVGRAWPPVWWWTHRQTLAEEHAWRATRPKGTGWHGPETQPIWLEEATGQPPQVVRPERLAGLYRALRKAQEDRKNEPGAADFYYGEMEMRRLASATPWAERVILFWYWLVAGYGLRGLRALAALGVLVVALAGLFYAVGFLPAHPAPSWWDSLLYTAGSTLSISDNTLQLTAWGKLLRILLRLLGPLLLGLALLSVRNRVKR